MDSVLLIEIINLWVAWGKLNDIKIIVIKKSYFKTFSKYSFQQKIA